MKDYRPGRAHRPARFISTRVWTTKYRKPVMTGEVGIRLRELIREICGNHEVTIIKGHISKDHVHLFVSAPAAGNHQPPGSRCSRERPPSTLMHEFPHLAKKFWGRHMWARGYFCVSSGNVTDEVIAQYIEQQNHDQDSDFRIEGEPDAS